MPKDEVVSIDVVVKRLKQIENDAEENLTISDAPTLLKWIKQYRRQLETLQDKEKDVQ